MTRMEHAVQQHESGSKGAFFIADTDGKHVAKLGTKVYGFCPVLYSGPEEMLRIHGHDERVSVDSMRWGTRVLYEVVERFCRR